MRNESILRTAECTEMLQVLLLLPNKSDAIFMWESKMK